MPQHSAPTKTRIEPTATFALILPSATPTFTVTPEETSTLAGNEGAGNPTNTPDTSSPSDPNSTFGNKPSTPTATPTGAISEAMLVPVTAQARDGLPIWYYGCGGGLIALLLVAYLRLVVFKRQDEK